MRQPRTVYLAGPMAGHPEHNWPAFENACAYLRHVGFEVLSPHEVDHGEVAENRGTTKPHGEYMRKDLELVLKAQGVVLLPGWFRSKGAMIEVNLAVGLGLPIATLTEIKNGVYFQ